MIVGAIFVVIITIFFPPLGAFIVSGCGMDLFINICLTILGVIPGHVHAFYLEYIYYSRKEAAQRGEILDGRAPGVYSQKVLSGGHRTYGAVPVQQPGYVQPGYS